MRLCADVTAESCEADWNRLGREWSRTGLRQVIVKHAPAVAMPIHFRRHAVCHGCGARPEMVSSEFPQAGRRRYFSAWFDGTGADRPRRRRSRRAATPSAETPSASSCAYSKWYHDGTAAMLFARDPLSGRDDLRVTFECDDCLCVAISRDWSHRHSRFCGEAKNVEEFVARHYDETR